MRRIARSVAGLRNNAASCHSAICDGHATANCYTDAAADLIADCHSNEYFYSDVYTDAFAKSYTYGYEYSCAHCYANQHADSHTYPATYAYPTAERQPDPVHTTGLGERAGRL